MRAERKKWRSVGEWLPLMEASLNPQRVFVHVNQAKTHRALLAGKFLLLVNTSVRPKVSKAL